MYSDADIETAELTRTANTYSRLRKKGICLHCWVCTPYTGPAKCNDCGKVWSSSAELLDERHNLHTEYL